MNRLNLVLNLYNIDVHDISMADEFIDSLVKNYDIIKTKKFNNKKSSIDGYLEKQKYIKDRRFYYKDTMNHIYRHLDSKLYDMKKAKSIRESLFTTRVFYKLLYMSDKKFMMYVLGSDNEHRKIYKGEDTPIKAPRVSMRGAWYCRTMYRFTAYYTLETVRNFIKARYEKIKYENVG